jgi:AcrR family transcriptional regulator
MAGRKRAARADGDATRARLLEVAGQLFARLGYAGAANKAICEAAGTDLAAINYHFGGRDGLYQAVLFEGYEQLINLQKLKEIHARQDSAENKLSAAIDMIVDRLYDTMQIRLSTEERQAARDRGQSALRLACERSPALITTADIADGDRRHAGCGLQALPHQGRHLAGRHALGARDPAAGFGRRGPGRDAAGRAGRRCSARTSTSSSRIRACRGSSSTSCSSPPTRRPSSRCARAPGLPQAAARPPGRSRSNSKQVSADLDPEAAATSFIGLIQGLVMQSMLTGRTRRPCASRPRPCFALYRRGLGEARMKARRSELRRLVLVGLGACW